MNIALTGASGFIGAAVAKRSAEEGHAVTALVREQSRREHIQPFVSSFVVGTHDDPIAVAQLLEDADVVIHDSFDWVTLQNGEIKAHLKSNLEGSINLLEASKDKQFIYMSSIAVHHHMHGKWKGNIDEAHPTRPGSLYGACKASVEAHMWAANASRNQQVTAIRPCAVYGIDPNLQRSIGWPMIESIEAGKPFAKLGGGKFVHVDDVAAATVAAINNPSASPHVYNLVDCYARWSDWARIVAEELGCEVDIDEHSPSTPKNNFDTSDVTDNLGVPLRRGMDGIRKHIKELINAR